MIIVCMGFVSCGSDNDDNINTDKGTDKSDNSSVDASSFSAVFVGSIDVQNELLVAVREMGVQCSKSREFSSSEEFVTNEHTGKNFAVTAIGLEPGTTYYYRTFYTIASRSYGEIKTFTTKKFDTSCISVSYGSPYRIVGGRYPLLGFNETTITINANLVKSDFESNDWISDWDYDYSPNCGLTLYSSYDDPYDVYSDKKHINFSSNKVTIRFTLGTSLVYSYQVGKYYKAYIYLGGKRYEIGEKQVITS